MTVMTAARTLGQICDWRFSNLKMQKVLYVAQMLHLGRTGTPLFAEPFEAWEYGPVVPRLYRQLKVHDRKPIPCMTGEVFEGGSVQFNALADAFDMVGHMTPSQLVSYTHRPGGAWEKFFQSGGISNVIPNSAILEEFQRHMRASDEAVAWAEQIADELAAHPPKYLDGQNERAFGARVRAARLH